MNINRENLKVNRIIEDLRFMNPLEIVLNYDSDNKMEETIDELLKLPLNQQKEFVINCRKQFDNVMNSYNKFIKIYMDRVNE